MFRRALLVFTDPDLRSKILKILGLLVVIRFLAYIPIPTLGISDISQILGSDAVFSLLNTISGGAYNSLSFIMLGVSPYITASIVMQLLAVIIPKLNEIRREEGELGRTKINRWTRYLIVPLAALQAWGIIRYLVTAGNANGNRILPEIFYQTSITTETLWAWFVVIVSMVAGSLIMTWIGEIITEYKMGNGISLIILAGIVVTLPKQFLDFWKIVWPNLVSAWQVLSANLTDIDTWKGVLWTNPEWVSTRSFLLIIVTFLFTLMLVIFVGEAVRKIPVVYSRRGYNENSSRTLSRVKSELPVKVNMAGVIPIIFAISFILFPSVIATFFSTSTLPQIQETALKVQTFLSTNPKISTPPENLPNNFLGFYKVNTAEALVTIQDYDPTEGQELFGFTLANLKAECIDETKNSFFDGTFLHFTLGCGQIDWLPTFAIHWKGVLAYNFFYFALIIFFTYFYTANVAFKVEEIAEDLQKSGIYIPGYKPGEETQTYLQQVSNRLNVVGSLFLAVIAVLPIFLNNNLQIGGNIINSIIGGTTLLILVSVTIESLSQIMAQATSIDYDRFTRKSKT